MRALSQTALQAVLSQQTEQVFLVCLKITHPDLAEPLRFVNDTVDLVRTDGTYVGAAFEFRVPGDAEDNIPEAQIVLDNVDRQIVQAIRGLKTAPVIEANIVMRSSPNVVEIGPISFKLRQFNYDADTIRGALRYDEDFLNESYPYNRFTPFSTPGIF